MTPPGFSAAPTPAGRLWRWFGWGIALALLLSLFLAGFVRVRLAERQETINLWTGRVEALADARKRAVSSWLGERYADAQVMAWDADLMGLCREEVCPKGIDPAVIASELDTMLRFNGFLGSYLFTPAGELLLMAEAGLPPRGSTRPNVRRAARERRFVLDDIEWIDPETVQIGFLAPVFERSDPADRSEAAPVIGVVGLYLDPRPTLFPLVHGSDLDFHGLDVYLVRKEGDEVRVLTPSPAAPLGQMIRVGGGAKPSVEVAAVGAQDLAGEFDDRLGRPVVAAVRWIPEAGWGLVAQVDLGRVLAPWWRTVVWESVLAGTSLLCLLLAGLAAWRTWAGRRYRVLLEGLRDREERLRALAHGTDDLVFIKDPIGRYLLVNPATARLLGVDAHAARGKRASNFLSPRIAEALESHDRQVVATGEPFTGEETIPVGGEERTYLSSRIPLRDAHGIVSGVAGVLRDITERKREEAELASRAQTLDGLYQMAGRLAVDDRAASVLETVLDGAMKAFGGDFGTLHRLDVHDETLHLVHSREGPPELMERVKLLVEGEGVVGRALETGSTWIVEDYARHPDALDVVRQSAGIVSLAAVPFWAQGRVLGVMALGFHSARTFSEFEREALDTLGHMAGVALERALARESLEAEMHQRVRAEGRLRRFHDATAGFTGRLLFERVVETLCAELGTRWVVLSRLEGEARVIPLAAADDGRLFDLEPYPLAGTPCEEVVRTGTLVQYSEGFEKRFPRAIPFAPEGVGGYAGVPLTDSRGVVIGVLCAFQDGPMKTPPHLVDVLGLYGRRTAAEVERLRGEASLAETRRSLNALIENLPGAVYRAAVRPERPLAYISAGCRKVVGYPAETLLGRDPRRIIDWVVPEERGRVLRTVREAVAAGRAYELEYRIHDAKGEIRWVYDIGRAVTAPGGETCLEGVLFDHTERRSLEAQLTHSQRMESLGRLAGGVAHDFNNLLTAISGYAEILRRRLPEEEKSQRACSQIVKASERAAELTRKLLAFSRRQVIEARNLDLDEALRDVVDILHRVLGEDVALDMDLGAEGRVVRIDGGQFEQVVMNLVVNARDAMPTGGTIRIVTERESDGVILRVSDTGDGIPPEVVEHIFEPFFTTKGEGEGTGLGLATVYGIVIQAGGTIAVDTEQGRGTTFRIRWPCVPSSAEASSTDTENSASQKVPVVRARVALVEDDDPVRELAAEHLAGLGYRVEAYADAEAAEAALGEAGGLDLLVTDVVMPGIRGPELARRLRRRWKELPVLFVSGHAGETIAELDLDTPGTSFLQKPFRLEAMEAAVAASLKEPGAGGG